MHTAGWASQVNPSSLVCPLARSRVLARSGRTAHSCHQRSKPDSTARAAAVASASSMPRRRAAMMAPGIVTVSPHVCMWAASCAAAGRCGGWRLGSSAQPARRQGQREPAGDVERDARPQRRVQRAAAADLEQEADEQDAEDDDKA